MEGLQRSTTAFRRQGSSGLVWDDKLVSGELRRLNRKQEDGNRSPDQLEQEQGKGLKPINTVERSPSNGGGRAFRTGKVAPAIEPPSPRLSSCGFCGGFGKKNKTRRQPKSGKRRM